VGIAAKATATVREFVTMLDRVSALVDTAKVVDVLMALLEGTGYLILLKESRDPQENARAENVEELVGLTREFQVKMPEGTLIDFLTEVALSSAVDDLDDESGTVSLMTLHTAKGLEFDAVFITGIEEEILPHRISVSEAGGIQEERRLFYVGITRAKKKLHLSLATSRATFGEIASCMPSRFLAEIPNDLVDWRESGRRSLSPSFERRSWDAPAKPRTEWTGAITREVRDNSGMELATGDRIRHDDFGDGRVLGVTGDGAKRIAEVMFDGVGKKKLLIKIAPIEKL
jgi:DNA helicase-2/ATP-dependent DNA helicase PcrA